jgi:hypothetical protein
VIAPLGACSLRGHVALATRQCLQVVDFSGLAICFTGMVVRALAHLCNVLLQSANKVLSVAPFMLLILCLCMTECDAESPYADCARMHKLQCCQVLRMHTLATDRHADKHGVQVALEGKTGFVWGLGLCILGSPVACAYLAWKVHQGNYGFVQGAREGSQYYQ